METLRELHDCQFISHVKYLRHFCYGMVIIFRQTCHRIHRDRNFIDSLFVPFKKEEQIV